MTTFSDIVARANEIKARKQADFKPLMGSTYREDEKITSQISVSDHTSKIDDPQSLGILSKDDSLQTLSTERAALLSAGAIIEIDPNPPLMEAPDKYKTKRPCTCKTHTGAKWRPLAEFGERKGTNGKMYPLSWCNECRARIARERRAEAESLKRFP